MAPPSDAKKPPTAAPLRHDFAGAFLSFLVPGLGQIFQGRVGKGILFLVCIYTLFFYGMYLGGWRNVFLPRVQPYEGFDFSAQKEKAPSPIQLLQKDGVPEDVIVKLKSLPSSRYGNKTDLLAALHEVLTPDEVSRYRSLILSRTGVPDTTKFPEVVLPLGIQVPKPLAYRVPYLGQFWVGVVSWPAIIQFWMYDEYLDDDRPAPVLNKFMRAPTEIEANEMQNQANKTWDIGWVYTVIAGVLNIMVIYDALVGPAFIPGNPADDKSKKQKTGAKDAAAR